MIELYVAERLDDLAVALAERLREPMADPFTPEVLVVPTSGMQRWLSLELSRRLGTSGFGRADGVSANLDMRFPGSLDRLLTSRDDDFDPWELDRLAWVLLEVLADAPESAESAPPPAPGATRMGTGTASRRPVRPVHDAPAGHDPGVGDRHRRRRRDARSRHTHVGNHTCGVG
ncbi:MAG: exodeoxyribonuclease V subunit gamma [Microthrixaceae bacterium]|nr:exodeoxyribonuclease V subunit gamma [Microthrixaceae bacterium]